ncbi:MAG: TVP38/TMEM64 family protein [Verrucomicrobiota bacterium]
MDPIETPAPKKTHFAKPVLIVGLIAGIALGLNHFGVFDYFSKENIGKLSEWIEGFGIWGPVVYVAVYIVAVIFFIPGLAITLIAGVFGPVKGTILVSIASTIGASLAFLIARYAMRPMVEAWASKNPVFKKIDDGVDANGWRMVMLTRLVPLFPFNLQNYAYGLTKVNFLTYVLVSWIFMLPGTIAYVFASGSLIGGEGDMTKTLIYLGVAGIVFVGLSFLPGLLKRKMPAKPAPASID